VEYEVVWSPEAREDLQNISHYIARDSAYYAQAVVTEILAVSRSLAEFPFIGRIVPEVGDEQVRERFVYSYRLERKTTKWFA
jgi:toxin ParE1/3/4